MSDPAFRLLEALGVVFINLRAEEFDGVDGHGNRYRYFGWFVQDKNGRSSIVDIYFDYNPGSEQ